MAEITYKTIVLIDKPKDLSSNHALSQIKRIISSKVGKRNIPKIGHGGTLDPLATGLLIVGITRAGTKTLNTHIDSDKVYECEVDLLKSSETGDLESFEQHGIPNGAEIPTLDEVRALIAEKFIGEVEQTPPVYSALKIGGKKACDLARDGEEVDMSQKSRKITLYSVEVLSYEFPILRLQIHCSKGTYIRTVGQDIGNALGLYGTLLSLHRIKSGDHNVANARKLDSLTFEDLIEK